MEKLQNVQPLIDAFEKAVDALLQERPKIADPLREVGLAAFYLPYQGYDDRALQTKLARLYAEATSNTSLRNCSSMPVSANCGK